MTDLRAAVQAHQELVARLRAEFPDADDQTIADTAEGITELDLAIAAVLREAVEAEAMAKGLAELLRQSQERKRRLESRADKLRAVALAAAEDGGIKSLRTPDMTASVMHGKAAVIVTDDQALPDWAVEIFRKPLKSTIGDELRAGNEVPGATLGSAAAYWLVRRV